MTTDIQIFNFINGLANHSKIADFIGIFLAEYMAYVLIGILIVMLFYPKVNRIFNRKMVIVSGFAATIARFVIKELIIVFYHRPRPFIVQIGSHKLISTTIAENYQSFPSGHAIFFFALAMALYCFNKKIGIWYFIAALIMGLARVFVGVHLPSDILGGAVLGMLTGWGIYKLYIHYKSKIDHIIQRIFSALHL